MENLPNEKQDWGTNGSAYFQTLFVKSDTVETGVGGYRY